MYWRCKKGVLADRKLCFRLTEKYFLENESKTWELFSLFTPKTERHFFVVLYYKTVTANSLAATVEVMIFLFHFLPTPLSHSAEQSHRN